MITNSEQRPKKAPSSPAFSLDVDGVNGACPAGEKHAQENISEGKIPVLSCEGPCIRGEVARLAANIVAEEEPYARSCYAETFLVPHSSMAEWVKDADKVVMIDGCFLLCLGRVLNNFIDAEKIIHIDALRFVAGKASPSSRRAKSAYERGPEVCGLKPGFSGWSLPVSSGKRTPQHWAWKVRC